MKDRFVIPAKKNIVLIGMPGAGKTTVGVLLAQHLSKKFVDTDLLIQSRFGVSLQKILDDRGYLELRRIEEAEIMRMEIDNCVVATGGSAAYSEQAMGRLGEAGIIVYLKSDRTELLKRIDDYATRGIARKEGQSFEDLFDEREPLYRRYADVTIESKNKSHRDIVKEIADELRKSPCGLTS